MKKPHRIYDLLNAETNPIQSFFVYRIQSKENIFTEKEHFKKKWKWRIEQKTKRSLLTALAMVIKKDSTTSIGKYANELKVYEKTVWTVVKEDLSPNLSPFNCAIWGVLENKTNATSHPYIGSLKTVIEEEWNKMSDEFILKACKSFQRRVDTIIEKMAVILSKFTVLCLSSYFVYFLNQN